MSLNEIATRNDLADFLGVPRKLLSYLLYVKHIDNCYFSFKIPKKNGGERIINAPNEELKSVQEKIAYILWEHQKKIWENKGLRHSLKISHAFEEGRSFITNAKAHRNKRYILNVDLSDFFDSIHFGRVQGFFEKNNDFRVSKEASIVIAQLTCYKGSLPQGAPSSPIITNLICQILDFRLLKLAKEYKLTYTRYADDFSFSTNHSSFIDHQHKFLDDLSQEIERAGFSINNKKTRMQFKDSRQTVTGLVVNHKLSVSSEYCNATRGMAHSFYTKGEFKINGELGSINQLEGRFAYINQIDLYNNKIDGRKHTFRELNCREKQYQKFLFYKYFYNNEKPLIVSEGPTDVIYLKAALKGLYSSYPSLITKEPDGSFIFKVSFLRRTQRLKYFFDFSAHGADTIKSLYNFFSGKRNCPNYREKFFALNAIHSDNPVIFFFDNETNNGKPLAKFIQETKLSSIEMDVFKEKKFHKVFAENNLFLMTHPLEPGEDEGQIEDLFDKETLDHKIGGKSFSLDNDYDKSKYYGKVDFSKYIYRNHETIDFSNFRKVLDTINAIIENLH